jgi:predicted DNA-binding transcriptional regulator AlpA
MKSETEPEIDRVLWRHELCAIMGVTTESIQNWMKSGKLPRPDVDMSRKTKGWRLSTLRAAGINLV